MLIFLIGVRGSGKSSCIDHLRTRSDLRILQPSTTRNPRNAQDAEYDFRAAFDVPMAWQIPVNQHHYGMRQSEIDKVSVTDVGLTVFEPGNIQTLLQFREASAHEVVIIGLDTISDVAQQAARVGAVAARTQTQAEIDRQRALIEQHADVILRGTLSQNLTAIDSTIRVVRYRGGVVDGRTILNLACAGTLLRNYDAGSVQSASYDLRIGTQLLFDGGMVPLTAEKPTFSVPPYSFIIAEALEIADLPKFLSGRFDLRVSHFMKGMILSNGPQVDPGFRGALFCMLYNASDRPIAIKREEHFATIEFHTTALGTTTERTKYHAFEHLQRLSADILERPGSKLLSRIDAVVPAATAAWGRWSVVLAILVAIVVVPGGWALTVLSDSQKAVAELKVKLAEADEIAKKLKVELDAAREARKSAESERLSKTLKPERSVSPQPKPKTTGD